MLIDSASSATLNQDMFWHGLSLVSSRVKRDFIESMVIQRERNIGQLIMFWVMTDITGAWTAAFIGNQISVFALIRLRIRCG